jgi:outer membrane protein assembly factor BamA
MGGEGINITHLCASCAQALLFEPAMRNYYEPYCVLEPALDLMHVDDSLNPRVGFTTHVGARVMMACKTPHASFARLWGEQAFFVPLSARLVGALRLRAGYIACQSFSCLMPSERFYLGGSCSIRSYQQDYMPPLAKCVVTNRCVWMPLGSRIMLSINAEARVTVSANVGLVFFQDVGALWHEKQRCFYTGGATGFGFRYLTPIGPLRFDIGIKNKQSPDDCLPLAWFLTIGHAF